MGYHNHYNDVGFARGSLSPAKAVARIRAMGEKVLAAAKEELRKGADLVVADAKSRCPVRTGKLRDSIRAVSNKDGSVYWIVADASVESPKSPIGRFYYVALKSISRLCILLSMRIGKRLKTMSTRR